MKKIFLIIALFFTVSMPSFSEGESSMLDFDSNFIDNPFAGQKAISNEEFDRVVNRMTQKPEGFWQKVKVFFLGRNALPDAKIRNGEQQTDLDIGDENKLIKDIGIKKASIVLGVAITGNMGEVIPVGHYSLDRKTKNGQDYIVFKQGSKIYGEIRAKTSADDNTGKEIIYAKTENVSGNAVKIIYSDIDGCLNGFARIYE